MAYVTIRDRDTKEIERYKISKEKATRLMQTREGKKPTEVFYLEEADAEFHWGDIKIGGLNSDSNVKKPSDVAQEAQAEYERTI